MSDPSQRAHASQALVTIRTRVDDHFAAALRRTPEAYACREGCAQCCHRRFSVFEVEAAPIREALDALAHSAPELRERVRQQATDPAAADRCALLVDGRCSVYEARPLICRAHGLPTGVPTGGGQVEVDVCPLNFSEAHGTGADPIPAASVLLIDALNQPLAVMAELFDPGGARVELAHLAMAPDARKNPSVAVDPGPE